MDDISTGAKIGIGLVILCFLVMITLSLLQIVKNITNQGTTTLQTGLDQMLQTQFDDYDQMIKTGTEVMAAVKLFNGQPIGIVVVTTRSANEGTYPGGYNYGALLAGAEQVGTEDSDPQWAIQAEWGEAGPDGSRTMDLKSPIEYNMNTKPTSYTGTDTFVRTSARFLAELIKDSTGTTVGILFTQQS